MLSVKAVASTVFYLADAEEAGYIPHYERLKDQEPELPEGEWTLDDFGPEWNEWYRESYPQDIDELHEAAGRGCYQSWSRPNPKTATNKGYLGNIIDVQHESVLGHGHVTFYVSGVSRALLLELERHAEHMNINFSVVSQRYVDHGAKSDIEVVTPPLFDEELATELNDWFLDAQERYAHAYHKLRDAGNTVKEARGAARAFLPEATETRFFVTGSIRAWRDIIRKRATDGADIEIRLFAIEVLRELIRLAPNSVQDFAEQYANDLGESK